MSDEKWDRIHGKPLEEQRPPAPKLTIPRVLGSPTCAKHCGGNHSVDAVIKCPKCRTIAARVVKHAWAHDDGHYFSTVSPENGYKIGDPSTCRDCGSGFEREEVR
mgnify:FL=1